MRCASEVHLERTSDFETFLQPTPDQDDQAACAFSVRPQEEGAWDLDGICVLTTTIADQRNRTDLEILNASRSRDVVEKNLQWMKRMKGPLALAPVFLKTPSKIRDLGFVFILALQIFALIQNLFREAMKTWGKNLPPSREKAIKSSDNTGNFGSHAVREFWNSLGPESYELVVSQSHENSRGVCMKPRKCAIIYYDRVLNFSDLIWGRSKITYESAPFESCVPLTP